MGTRFVLTLHAPDAELAERAAARAFERLDELDAILSDYDEDSELRRLCAASASELAQPTRVSLDLWRVLVRAREVSERTDGAFDVSVGPAVRLWRRARRQAQMPSPERLSEALALIGYRGVRLDEREHSVAFALPGMRLDLGGIAKGYALDQMLACLAELGIESALVDGGGDVAASAPPPGRAAWRVRVESMMAGSAPRQLPLAHASIATSGDAYQFVELEGRRYSHIVDPRTALGLSRSIAASVEAADAALADALASALCVLGPEGLRRLSAWPEVRASVVTLGADGEPELHEWPPQEVASATPPPARSRHATKRP